MKKGFLFCLVLLIVLPACTYKELPPTTLAPTSAPKETTLPTETTATEETASPIPEKARFIYSPYLLSPEALAFLGDDYALYCDMVDSVIDYDGKVSGFRSEEHFLQVWRVLLYEFVPAQKVCATYNTTDTPYRYENGTVQLFFALEKERHDRTLLVFEERINSILSLIGQEDGEVEIVAKMYEYVSYQMTYIMKHDNMYDSIMHQQGICGDYAEFMVYLLRHTGIRCQTASSFGAGIDHKWVIAEMEGKLYHFDPTWQSAHAPWTWFAVGDEKRLDSVVDGFSSKEDLILIGVQDLYAWKDYPVPECSSKDFCEGSRAPEKAPWLW